MLVTSMITGVCLIGNLVDAKFEQFGNFLPLREPDITRALNNGLQPARINPNEQVQPELEPLEEEMFEALRRVPSADQIPLNDQEVQLDPLEAEIPELEISPANALLGLLRQVNPEAGPSIAITIDDIVEGGLPEPSEILGEVVVTPSNNPERRLNPGNVYFFLRAHYPNAFINLAQLRLSS